MDPATSKTLCFLLPNPVSTCPMAVRVTCYQPLTARTWAALSFVPIKKRSRAELASVPTAVSLTENGAGKVGKASSLDSAKSFLPTRVAQAHTC